MELSGAAAAAARFAIAGRIREVRRHSGGHIHESHVVTTDARRYLLQRMNTRVFAHPDLVMENIAAVTGHLRARGERTLRFVEARTGGWLVRDEAGDVWRLSEYVEGAMALEIARDAAEAERAAEAFGRFQRVLLDYAGPPLHVTIPGFHDTVARIEALDRAVAADPQRRVRHAGALLEAIDARRLRLGSLFHAAAFRFEALRRIAHHDAKIANVLFDARSGEAICIVDLDTVMPGLSLFDFGDLVRSMVSAAAEDEPDSARVVAEPERFAAIARGYRREMGRHLIDDEIGLLPLFGETMVFEQGVRFLTDYLEGDRYYAIARPRHNLERAHAQIALLRSLEEQSAAFRRMVGR